MSKRDDRREGGQATTLLAILLAGMLMAIALTIDGSNAWVERRKAQNAADLAAMAATKVVMEGGTDAQVRSAINTIVAANGGRAVAYGAANNGPRYVDAQGRSLNAYVGGGSVPSTAYGVSLSVSVTWRPTLTGVATIFGGSPGDWTASASATSKYAWVQDSATASAAPTLPVAVLLGTIPTVICPLPTPWQECPGGDKYITFTTAASGQHGWMSWNGTGNVPYLRSMVGPPARHPAYTIAPNSYIVIPGMSGNKNALKDELNWWADSQALIYVPIVSPGTGVYPGTTTPYPPSYNPGSRGSYNVIGFAGVQLTGCINPCITNLRAVFRTGLINTNTTTVPIYRTDIQLVN